MKKGIILGFIAIGILLAGSLHAKVAVNPPIYAGQHTIAGWAWVDNTCGFLNISITMNPGWLLKEVHVEVVQDPSLFPTTSNGNPKIGQFTYSYKGAPLTGFTFPPIDTGYPSAQIMAYSGGPCYNPPLYFAIHVVVVNSLTGQQETGWANPCAHPSFAFNPNKDWGWYIQYCWSYNCY